MKRLLYALPVLAFAVLAYFLFHSLISPAPDVLPSMLLNKPVPATNLPPAIDYKPGFSSADLAQGHVTVVNVVASWCAPCWGEAPVLAKLSKMPGVTLYGFFWKDPPEKAREFLVEAGDPFTRIGIDVGGGAGLEWGVTAPPETFIVDGKGIIRAKFIGGLTEDSLASDVLPAIERARQNQ